MFKINAMAAQPSLFLAVYGGDPNNPSSSGFTLAPLVRNTWDDFVFHVKWATDSTGFVEVWLNGQLVVPKTYLPTIYSGQNVYLKQGFYRPSYSLPTVLYEDGMRRGTSYADVAAGFGGTSSTPTPPLSPTTTTPTTTTPTTTTTTTTSSSTPRPPPQPPPVSTGPDAPLISSFSTSTDSGCAPAR